MLKQLCQGQELEPKVNRGWLLLWGDGEIKKHRWMISDRKDDRKYRTTVINWNEQLSILLSAYQNDQQKTSTAGKLRTTNLKVESAFSLLVIQPLQASPVLKSPHHFSQKEICNNAALQMHILHQGTNWNDTAQAVGNRGPPWAKGEIPSSLWVSAPFIWLSLSEICRPAV